MSLVLCISLRRPGTSMGNLSNKLKVRFAIFYLSIIIGFTDSWTNMYTYTV